MNSIAVIFIVSYILKLVLATKYDFINVPHTHLPYYFSTFPGIAEQCRKDVECSYAEWLNDNAGILNKCWGYESNCVPDNAFSRPQCLGDSIQWMPSKEEQANTFYSQADFGYVKHQINELRIMCTPLYPNDSSLECSKYLRFCRGRNIMMNFTTISTKPARYQMDVLKHGQIGKRNAR